MLSIKFSKHYRKITMGDDKESATAVLLDAFVQVFDDISDDFLTYDCAPENISIFTEVFQIQANYDVIVLFFKDVRTGGLFTTIRRYNREKYSFYKRNRGKVFAVEFPPGMVDEY